MLSLSGHIGSKVSALVDGQLAPAEEERAWSHVLTCPGCRRLVEHEGWTKRQLGALCGTLDGWTRRRSCWVRCTTSTRGPPSTTIEKQSRRRRATAVVLVGGGAVGACLLGLVDRDRWSGRPWRRPDPALAGDDPRRPGRQRPGGVTDRC